MRKIKFTRHASAKFNILRSHGFPISQKQVREAVTKADRREKGKGNRVISQKKIDQDHVLRVIHEEFDGKIIIVTFYPGRRSYYES